MIYSCKFVIFPAKWEVIFLGFVFIPEVPTRIITLSWRIGESFSATSQFPKKMLNCPRFRIDTPPRGGFDLALVCGAN
jgi:hypothetical protein